MTEGVSVSGNSPELFGSCMETGLFSNLHLPFRVYKSIHTDNYGNMPCTLDVFMINKTFSMFVTS